MDGRASMVNDEIITLIESGTSALHEYHAPWTHESRAGDFSSGEGTAKTGWVNATRKLDTQYDKMFYEGIPDAEAPTGLCTILGCM